MKFLATDKIGNQCRIALGDYQYPSFSMAMIHVF